MTFAEAFAALRGAAADRGHGAAGVQLSVEAWLWPDGSTDVAWRAFVAAVGRSYQGKTPDDVIAAYCTAYPVVPQLEAVEAVGEVSP